MAAGDTPNSNVVVVVPNSNLTRPGDWKYNETPLRNFHWGHGCQRLRFFDGRPYHSRSAHERLINHELTRNWIDLCPSRRTAALIGVLNVRDCPDQATLERAVQEWRQWAERYSTPPYEVTAHGRDVGRDTVVPRLFVFDSFHEDFVTNPDVDLQAASDKLKLEKDWLVAFPPSDQEMSQMMDLHVNVVVNDLTVAVFKELEGKIKESDSIMHSKTGGAAGTTGTQPTPAKTGFFGRSNSNVGNKDEESPMGTRMMSIDNLASVVSANSELASPSKSYSRSNSNDTISSQPPPSHHAPTVSSSVKGQLLTPLDEFWEFSELSPKDAHMMMKREVARRQKFTADLCLLAGSPLDAYERYTKAADLCKTTSPDPLWYASALEGCAAVHIAMADVGGFNVDEYLDSSFQLPEEFMSCALLSDSGKEDSKKTMPQVILALCEDALNVTARHPKTASFHAELLLKLAWYTADIEDVHLRCQWGLGGDNDDLNEGDEYCYEGDPENDKRRWEMASATRLNFLELTNKEGEDVIQSNNLKRCQKCSEFMHRAAASAALDPVTRADVALQCLAISWTGIRPTVKPTDPKRSTNRIQLKRKAAFFAVTAAEAMSDVHGSIPSERASAMWIQASELLSKATNSFETGGNYGWATLRAIALHALVIQGTKESSEEAAKQLLVLMAEIMPPNKPTGQQQLLSNRETPMKKELEGSGRSISFAGARSYIRDGAKQINTRSKELFGNQSDMSSLLVVQSKWVEDDPLVPNLVPMGDYSSDFALHVLRLPSVWSAIPFEHCAVAQERIVQQIYDLRKHIPVSSRQNAGISKNSSHRKLPVEITSITIGKSESALKLERVELKKKRKSTDHSMATFFNPYAKEKLKVQPITIPRGEEQYVSITFTNKLAIPFEVDSCKLEFNANMSSFIKAPSISFVIPGQTKDFAVRFPFIVLDKLTEDAIDTLEIKGIYVTSLSRSVFLPLGLPEGENDEDPILPVSSSLYPLRDYTKITRQEEQKSKVIDSPRLEITPQQPKLRVSFSSSATPMDSESIIPVLLADGEIFTLPKICISNDTGMDGFGMIEELQISATGLPELSEVVLYDMSKSDEIETSLSSQHDHPISISATCVGMDANTLNGSCQNNLKGSSYLAAKLYASSNMGAKTNGCDMTLRFRYRGKSVTSTLEVWRAYEVEVKILRVKGPRIPSLAFRCDLYWESGYSDLCHSLASNSNNVCGSNYDFDFSIHSSNKQEFVANRLGRDPGIHICSDKVVVMLSVANESSNPVVLTRLDGSSFGFPASEMDSLKVSKGVSSKFPILIPRVDRSDKVCQELINMTKFHWKSYIAGSNPEDAKETGGPMFPSNCRVREGILELPFSCLQTIIDENPIFLSRICKAPCSINVSLGTSENSIVATRKVVDVSVTIEMAKWLSSDLKKRTKFVLSFCCAKQNCSEDENNKENQRGALETSFNGSKKNNGFVWIGQTLKNLRIGESAENDEATAHQARIIFLTEGDYFVSACLGLSENSQENEMNNGSNNDVKEIWWAEKAAKIRVSKSIS